MFRKYLSSSELKNFIKPVNKIYNLKFAILEHNNILEFLSYCFSFISDKIALKNKFKDQQFQKTLILNVTFCILNVRNFFSLNLAPNLRKKSHGNFLNYFMRSTIKLTFNQQLKIRLSEMLTKLMVKQNEKLSQPVNIPV